MKPSEFKQDALSAVDELDREWHGEEDDKFILHFIIAFCVLLVTIGCLVDRFYAWLDTIHLTP